MSENKKSSHSLRIIGGQWRSRRLPIPDAEGLRPSGDRVRETLFNWLAPELPAARCLDLFAGTGALGIEALSRHAAFSQFVELDRQLANALGGNLQNLAADCTSYHIHSGDALTWLERYSGDTFDLIFVDPPFAADLWQQCIDTLAASAVLGERGLIYVESPADTKLQTPDTWQLHRELKAGRIKARLYRFAGQKTHA